MLPTTESTTPALQLSGVTKRYPYFDFGPVDLAVAPGTTLGLLGANGAGKSTLLRLLLGLVLPDAGEVQALGLPMPERQREIKAEVGFVSEDMALYGGATLAWHLRFVRSLSPRWDTAFERELLARFALHPGQRIRGLSRGQTVRVMLLLALVRQPRLLLLDEPTSGLDPRVRHQVRAELAALARERRTTIVFSSHLTEDVEALADEVAILDAGRIVRRAPLAELQSEGPLEQVFLTATSRTDNASIPAPRRACA